MSEILQKAQNRQQELAEIINSSKTIQQQRPVFHFSVPGGWCNDPNGFSQFNGKIHLFYQYHPYSTKWGPMHWGHATSANMLNWKQEPVALAPDTLADAMGCFSGTAVETDQKQLIVYTGVSNNGEVDVQNQCMAEGNGQTYIKLKENPVLTAADIPFQYNIEHFRDPKIWKKDNKYYMVCVIKQKNDRGAMVMFYSDDAKKWTYKGVLDSSRDGLSKMWECPDVTVIDGKDILIFSPQEVEENYELGFKKGNNSVYVTGILDYKKCIFNREIRPENGYTAAAIDYGIDFYAPETTKLSDGRTIIIGWMQSWEAYITPADYIWSGMMTLPRELSLKNGRLYQSPIKELESWKTEENNFCIKSGCSEKIVTNEERYFELDLSVTRNYSGYLYVTLGNELENIFLKLDLDENSILFDRSNSQVPGAVCSKKSMLRINADDKEINLKIICDTCSLEVFVNEGIMTFTNAYFFSSIKSDLIVNNKMADSVNCKCYKIKPHN